MSALDERLRGAAAVVREEMDEVTIPEPATARRGARPPRRALVAIIGAAALVVVISVVVAFASRDRHAQPVESQPASVARMSALAVSDLPAGWKSEPFVANTLPNCLPSFTNVAVDQAALQFLGPSRETMQEMVAWEPDDAHQEFELANMAMERCSSKPTDLPAIGDESGVYFVTNVRAPGTQPGDENLDAAVALVRLGDLRINVIVFRHGISEHTLEPLVRAAVRKVAATQTLQPCQLGDLAFDYYGGGASAGNDFGTIRVRDTAPRPCVLKGPIAIAGIDRTGNVVTQARTYPVAAALVLTARAARVPAGQEPRAGEVVGRLDLAASYRDDNAPPPADELCTKHQVIPAAWRLTLPAGVRTVANASTPKAEFSSLITCRGQLDTAGTITADFDPGPVSPPPS